MRWILIIAATVSLFAGGGAVFASDSASPGDALYGLDRAIENMRLEQAADSLSALKLQLAFAEERLEEAEQLAAEGDMANYELALDEYDAAIQQVASMVGAAEEGSEAALETVLDSGLAEQDLALDQMSPPADEGDDEDEDDDEDPAASKWCLTVEQHKVGLRLAALHEVNYEEIMGWFCQGAGFGDIKIAYEIYALVGEVEGISVQDLFDMFWIEGLEWGDIRAKYGLVGNPDDDDDSDDVDDDDDIDVDEDGQGNWCVSEGEHPVGGRLAEQFGVDYELIIGWHCQGIGFGEIALALGIAKEAGEEAGEEAGVDAAVLADELLEKHANGTGWGEIKKEYDVSGKPDKDKPDKPGKPEEDKDKDKDKDNPGKAKGHDKDK